MRHSLKITLVLTLLLTTAGLLGQTFSWQKPHAKVLPTGDLEWAPEPFQFSPGKTVRYIDYENGDDNNAGTKDQPWKHHPWDGAAAGKAAQSSGPITYVFKRGVIYRGSLVCDEAGKPGDPIRLTSDPDWGTGEAMVYGSQQVTNWTQGADHPDIPQGDKVWKATIERGKPRTLFMVDKQGNRERIHLARTPNWEVSDPDDVMSQWWSLTNPQWWLSFQGKMPNFVEVDGKKVAAGVDTKNLTEDPEYYEGAYAWVEWGLPMMGMPYAVKVKKFDPEKKALALGNPFFGGGMYMAGNRYFLENKPHYLDQGGEFYFDRKGRGGTIYVRLPGDVDPNSVQMEAGDRIALIDANEMRHVEITGLSFRFNNLFWDLDALRFSGKNVQGGVIRVMGTVDDLRISNCTFEHVSKAIRLEAQKPGQDYIDNVMISDNVIHYVDYTAVAVHDARGQKKLPPYGPVKRVDFLRNNLLEIGQRPPRSEKSFAVFITNQMYGECAGNILHRTHAAGLFLQPIKSSGELRDAPIARVLVHHNKVTDSMLSSNDWGGIEVNQGGPVYIYNNVSGNPGGYMAWSNGGRRFGFAYYIDGSFKKYLFNNIAWGKNNEPESKYGNLSAFQEIIGFENYFFNNTAYKFIVASRRQGPQAGRGRYMGNLIQDISQHVFRHSDAKAKDPNQADVGETAETFNYPTLAYTNNVFYQIKGSYGLFEGTGAEYQDLDQMRQAMKKRDLLAWQVGVNADKNPLPAADEHDFRPAAGSAAIDKGVKAFVPWSLYATVGEWKFCRNNQDPTWLIDDSWYMQPFYGSRQTYQYMPTFPLTAVNVTAEDFTMGQLEDWTQGALKLDGKSKYALLKHKDLTKDTTYDFKKKQVTVSGREVKTVDMDSNNFLIELHAKFAADQGPAGLVRKISPSAGYELSLTEEGGLKLVLRSNGSQDQATARAKLDDGKYHHVLVEVDRKRWMIAFYVDGKKVGGGGLQNLQPSASLSNNGDFVVGRSSADKYLQAELDFLRVCRGTLSEARTSIEELYAWQFDGPFLRDFVGNEPVGKGRDAGAIERTD